MIEKKQIYFLGIGGIGMSAIARYFYTLGYPVAGYDRFRNDICINMENIGINIHYEDDITKIPYQFKNKKTTLVVFTPAVPQDHNELLFFRTNNFEILKRSEVLGLISNSKKCMAIAGAHGKTSVSSICANIMVNTKAGCSAFLGGIAKNFNSNLVINKNSDYVVVEADEFDRSFLRLTPSTALITYIDSDHLDIYNNYNTLFEAFVQFGNLVKTNGNLILNHNISEDYIKHIRTDINIYRYGLNNKECDFYIDNIKYQENKCYFDLTHINGKISDISYSAGGDHNLENALAGASISILNGATDEDVRKGLETFEGVERRFDIKIKTDNFIYIDDYAHHPNEISAFLKSVRLIFPDKKITGIFQPHLYSRTRDFYKEFAESLSICDEIILLPIYPAREKPIEGITSEIILANIKKTKKFICEKNELIPFLKKQKPEILVTMGAGDIDQLIKPIITEFEK
ncbi:MAG: UDP-N-acetylmuramate--L-alanine ligase [Bacteroidales bacterium]|jgi:UDP-N-acetylmuramate--alanine ligase|nr:UDP-N-acetylmuramate--L-alanine ligase [Bacteroidales bacterium]